METNGILIIDKEKDVGSTDVVRIVKKIFNQKKVGHAGTLDFLATGVLPVCLGKATKVIEYLQLERKTYIAEVQLGMSTDTYDVEGKVIQKSDKKVSKNEVIEELKKLKNTDTQIPPMFSALKQNGKRLYDLARDGKVVDRNPRKIEIYDLNLLEFSEEEQRAIIEATVSKGTYIRSLINDLGVNLGSFAFMTNLRRTSCGGYDISQAVKINCNSDLEFLNENLIEMDSILLNLKKIEVEKTSAEKLLNGMTEILKIDLEDGLYRVFSCQKLIGTGKIFTTTKGKMLKLEKHLISK